MIRSISYRFERQTRSNAESNFETFTEDAHMLFWEHYESWGEVSWPDFGTLTVEVIAAWLLEADPKLNSTRESFGTNMEYGGATPTSAM